MDFLLRAGDEQKPSDARAVGPYRRVQLQRGKGCSDDVESDSRFWRKSLGRKIKTESSARGVKWSDFITSNAPGDAESSVGL